MGKKEEKTNVLRALDALGAAYRVYTYDGEGKSAGEIARALGVEPDSLFKTLVCRAKSGQNYVFMVRSEGELDLKKAAKAAGEKSMEMLPQKELLPLTGYVHGGCSPIGMKKQFPTFLDEIAILSDEICFSGGRVGLQVRTTLAVLQSAVAVRLADITRD